MRRSRFRESNLTCLLCLARYRNPHPLSCTVSYIVTYGQSHIHDHLRLHGRRQRKRVTYPLFPCPRLNLYNNPILHHKKGKPALSEASFKKNRRDMVLHCTLLLSSTYPCIQYSTNNISCESTIVTVRHNNKSAVTCIRAYARPADFTHAIRDVQREC